MKYKEALTFDDVSMVPVHSEIRSRKTPSTLVTLGQYKLKIPIIAAPMNTVTGSEMAKTMSMIGADSVIHRYMEINEQIGEFSKSLIDDEHVPPFVAVGAAGDFKERAKALFDAGVRRFCVDIANGHSLACIGATEHLANKYRSIDPYVSIMAGNVVTGDGARRLEEAGANVIRVGVGSGSVCKTRVVTGFGIPQLTAIEWCKDGVQSASIVADGGIRQGGDYVKAMAIGADAVMVGGILAGTNQSIGEFRKSEDGVVYKYIHGMASIEGRKGWFDESDTTFVPEGDSMTVMYKGDAINIINNLNNSLKVGMSFASAQTLRDLRKNAMFVRISDNGRIEGTPNKRMFKK